MDRCGAPKQLQLSSHLAVGVKRATLSEAATPQFSPRGGSGVLPRPLPSLAGYKGERIKRFKGGNK